MFQIDQELYKVLQNNTIKVKIHSCFHKALNFQSEMGLITFLACGKCLQPMSVRFEQPVDFCGHRFQQEVLYLSKRGLSDRTEYFFVFSDLAGKDLKLNHERLLKSEYAGWIRSFLKDQEEKGIHGMIEGDCDDVYASYLKPRIEKFRQAVKTRDCEYILRAVNKVAGCGPGLTPSSDDFICGYLSVMPQTKKYSEIRKTIADAAVAKTNDISASLLKNAEKGHFSEDILELFLGFKTDDNTKIEASLKKVADFGSTSGCDFLTGMYYGILDAGQKGR